MSRAAFVLAGRHIKPGHSESVNIPFTHLYTGAPLHLPVKVFHGEKDGPVLLVCAGIHGDELNGVDVIRRLNTFPGLKNLSGTLLTVPIVNLLGFYHQSRYLPDRRDLNRCFPGSESGSLAHRIAYQFKTQVVDKATHIIDLHTAAIHRDNLPQVRANLNRPENYAMAVGFGLPVILNAELREGSLRHMADLEGKPCITYEAGEALRFNDDAIEAGYHGVKNVMCTLGMLPDRKPTQLPDDSMEIANSLLWVRAGQDGILRKDTPLGAKVQAGQTLGTISDPFGQNEHPVASPVDGVVIGCTNLPLVHEGDALFNIAGYHRLNSIAERLESLQQTLDERRASRIDD